MISVEICFVCLHQFFMDTSRELHRVEQGWLYSFSHLRCAPEEIRFCLLRIPVYWQQHLLWILCKSFYMVDPTLYCKNSIQIKTIRKSFFLPLRSPYVHIAEQDIKKNLVFLSSVLPFGILGVFPLGAMTTPGSPAFYETTVGGSIWGCLTWDVFEETWYLKTLLQRQASRTWGAPLCGNVSFSKSHLAGEHQRLC